MVNTNRMRDNILKIEIPDSDPRKGRITHEGKQVNGIENATITINPNDFVTARLEVRASLTNVSAVGHIFPQWEVVTNKKPPNGSESLFLTEDGVKISGIRNQKGFLYHGWSDYAETLPTHFISLDWLDK